MKIYLWLVFQINRSFEIIRTLQSVYKLTDAYN